MAKNSAAPVFNIESTDPYIDAIEGAWLHLEDRRDYPPTKLFADPRFEQIAALNAAIAARNADTKKQTDAEIAEQNRQIEALRKEAEPRLPVRIKLLGFLADEVQEAAVEIDKETSAIRQKRFDDAKAAGADEAEAKKAAVLTDEEIAFYDAKLYAVATINSENLGYKGHAKLTRELAHELYRTRADIRAQVRDFMGKPANYKRTHVVH
jgi:hypothetical protein